MTSLALKRPLDRAEGGLKQFGWPFGARGVFDIRARMHNRQLPGSRLVRCRAQRWQFVEPRPLHHEEHVLRVPPLDDRVVPDAWTQAVDEGISTLAEQRCPVIRPLLVEVVVPALERN